MTEITDELKKALGAVKIDADRGEEEELRAALELFLLWLEPLEGLDAASAEPGLFSTGARNVLRDDQPQGQDPSAEQRVAPFFEEGYYRVPPVIE